MTLTDQPVLYVITCGAGPAGQVTRLISDARACGWDPYLVATPAALDFLDIQELEEQTGHPVRSEYRKPGNTASGRSLPKADAIIVAPATYNTINKWANGISDNYALGILAEAVGLHTPVVVLPFVNSALASHPAFQRSVALLRDAGINVIHGPGRLEPHPPGPEAAGSTHFPGTRHSTRPRRSATSATSRADNSKTLRNLRSRYRACLPCCRRELSLRSFQGHAEHVAAWRRVTAQAHGRRTGSYTRKRGATCQREPAAPPTPEHLAALAERHTAVRARPSSRRGHC